MITIGNKQLCEYCLNDNCGEPCRFCGFDKESCKKEVGTLPPGSVLSGKYIVGRIMGKGGFGITYLAYDISREKKVALKEYYPSVFAARDEDGYKVAVSGFEDAAIYKNGMEKFYEEASLVSTFNGNPNIVSVYEFFYENDTAYFVMELLSGCTMKAYIAEHGALSPEQTLYIADKVSTALMAVHSANTLHRDVSPDNIMLCADGKVKLIDFGAARQVAADNPKSMSVILKQGFAPLEQYQKRGKQGPWTDLYNLGATLYYALTTECIDDPMTRLDDDSEFQANSHGIEPQMWALLRHALNLKIEDRYKDVFEFRADMNNITYKPEPITVDGQDEPTQQEPVPAMAAQSATSQPLPSTTYQTSEQTATPLQQELPKTEYASEKKPKKKVITISVIALVSLVLIGVAVYFLVFRNKVPQEVTIGGKTFSTSEEFVELREMGLTDEDITDLKYFKNLKRVDLDGNDLYDISSLAKIPTLEEIDACDNHISDISFLKKMKNMKIIVMNNNDISDISVFGEFTTIEKIWMNDNDISDISPIAGNRGLLEVGFENCPIEGDIEALRGMDKIYMLALADCGITDISVLSTCTGLKNLYIGYNSIKDFSPLDGLVLEEYFY